MSNIQNKAASSVPLSVPKVLARRPGVKETSHQRSSNSSSGNLAGILGPRRSQRHQRGLQELRQNHPECQRPRTLRIRGRTGEKKEERGHALNLEVMSCVVAIHTSQCALQNRNTSTS